MKSRNDWIVDLTKKSNEFPPRGMDLSDACVVAVTKSMISGAERQDRYPSVFTSRSIKASYVHKGQAAKARDAANVVKYIKIFGEHTMFGDEGVEAELPPRSTKGTPHSTGATELSLTAQDPKMEYNFKDAAVRAKAARQKLEAGKRPGSTSTAPAPKRRSTKQHDQAESVEETETEEPVHATGSQTSAVRVHSTRANDSFVMYIEWRNTQATISRNQWNIGKRYTFPRPGLRTKRISMSLFSL